MSESRVEPATPQAGGIFKTDRALVWAGATPARLFWLFAGVHLTLWTIIPTLTSPNAPLDVIEGYAWGREWLIGTYKHPPMQAWWLGGIALLTDRAGWGHFLVAQIAIVTAFWAVWQTGRRMFSEEAALLGTLLLEGVVYYNFTSPEFNPNVLQLPFWALIGLSFHRAIKENRMADWLLLGLWSACGLYSKYSTALVLVSLGLLALVRPEGRRRIASPGPWLAAALAFLLFLPHLIWLFGNDFLPFTYAMERMHNAPQHTGFIEASVRAPFFYIISQVLAALPAILLFAACFDRGAMPKDERFRSFDRDFLDFITFGPFVLTLIMAVFIGVRIQDIWAMPFWNFLGLWAIARFRALFSPEALRRFAAGWTVIFTAGLLTYVVSVMLWPYVVHRVPRVEFPGRALAERVDEVWHQRFQLPLNYVIGDPWLAGNVAYYAPEWPHVLFKGDYRISPWVAPRDIEKSGGVLVWCLANCSYKNRVEEKDPSYLAAFPKAEIQPPIVLPRLTGAKVPPVKIGWALLPPADR